MSDRVSSAEIEDVLASVRRLVSTDGGVRPDRRWPDMSTRHGRADPEPAARLVLTPDFRVSDSDTDTDTDTDAKTDDVSAGQVARTADGAAGQPDFPAADEPDSDFLPPQFVSQRSLAGAGTDDDAEAQRARRVQTLEDRIAELEAAVNARAFEFEPDGSEDTEQHRPTRILSRTPQAPRDDHPGPEASSAGHPEGANDPAAPVGDPDATHAPSFRELLERETRSVLHTVIDFEEAAARNVNASGAVEEGPTDADGHDDAAWEAAEWQVESWEGDAQSSIDWTPTTAEAADEGEWDETDDLIAGLIYGGDDGAAPGAQAHADVGEGAEDAELFADAEESYRAEARRFDAALARSFEAEAPTHRQDALDAAPGVPSPPAEPEVDMSEEAVLDEETLRDMVAEIVREELQGALGERITRNVRKLVRREIMRAISIRDFQ